MPTPPHRPLLDALVADALDPAYADAADRRRRTPPRARSASVVLLLVGGLAVGLVFGRERVEAPAAEQARTALLGDAQLRTNAVAELGNRVEQLRQETARLQASVLTTTAEGRDLAGRRAALEASTGLVAAEGPGVELVVDDAPDAGAGRSSSERRPDGTAVSGRVRDRDLQLLVNALWAAGAEAVSVGDIRLSPTTAIRTAGETILADYRPLVAPYAVRAIGNPDTLPSGFRSNGEIVVARLTAEGVSIQVNPRQDLRLPASGGLQARVARPGTGVRP